MKPTLTAETMQKLARLARIHLDEAEVPELEKGIGEILGWMEKLEKVDVSDTEPMASLHGGTILISGQTEFQTEKPVSNALQHAARQPNTPKGFFSVPRVVE